MNTKNMTQEQISAFVDGEAGDAERELALAALRSEAGRQTWDVYHKLGDALRSDELALTLSPDFMTRFSARLEQEPTVLAPSAQAPVPAASPAKRYALPGMAAAAVALAAFALVGSPQLMVADNAAGASSSAAVMAASAGAGSTSGQVRMVSNGQNDILRDPAIDQYLMAHQRSSPSVYGTAQFARSATFAIDSNK